MKKTIIILILFPMFLFAQNMEPQQSTFLVPAIGSTPVYLSDELDYFKQNIFIKGNHWDSSPRLEKAAGYNQKDIFNGQYIGADAAKLNNGTYLYVKMQKESPYTIYYTHCTGSDILNARGIQYSPLLEIDQNLTNTLQTCSTSSRNPVFGFQTIVGTKDLQNDCLIVDNSIQANTVILDEPWVNDQLMYTYYNDAIIEKEYLSRGMYVTINLRRNGTNQGSDASPILKIEVPYIYVNSNNEEFNGICYIDSLPKTYNDAPCDFMYNRGKHLQLVEYDDSPYNLQFPPQSFEIKRNMLPQNNDNITVSAFIYLDDVKRPDNSLLANRFLIGANASERIKKLKLKVTYLGNQDIAINWIRFETPATKRLLAGNFDNDIKNAAQEVLNRYATTSLESRGIKFHRFNTHIEGGVQQWIGERYLSKLIGNIITGETGVVYPHLYEHYVGTADRWFGMVSSATTISVPYFDFPIPSFSFDYNTNYWETLNYFCGYKGMTNTNNFEDLFNSRYEIELRSGKSPTETKNMQYNIPENPFDENNYLSWQNCTFSSGIFSPLAFWESHNYYLFADNKTKSFLYSDKYWYHQSFPLFKMTQHNSSYWAFVYYHRALTGEEFRLQNFNPIIMGAKGLLYDGLEEHPDLPNNADYHLRMFWGIDRIIQNYGSEANLSNANDWEILRNSNNGGDYLVKNGEYKPYTNNSDQNYYDVYEQHLGVESDKIYLGRVSMRTEMKKIHTWIDYNQTILMKLRLQAWYGVGYKVWENQHPKYGSTDILSAYIDKDNIRTRKLIGYTYDNNRNPIINNVGWIEDKDSSFYDITLLSSINDENMSKYFYLGIQNRRTDPLVYLTDNEVLMYDNNPSEFKVGYNFIPTARFDELVYFGNPQNTTLEERRKFFNSLWWRRLGSRMIKIPIKPQPSYSTNEHYIFGGFRYRNWVNTSVTITELGAEMKDWYLQKPYNDKIINKTISRLYNKFTFTPYLLPGQGKIFRVTYNYEDSENMAEPLLFIPGIFLRTSVLFKGTNCDSLTMTMPLFSKGIPITLQQAEWEHTPLKEYTTPPVDTTLKPCTTEDLWMMTREPAKFVSRNEIVNGIPIAK